MPRLGQLPIVAGLCIVDGSLEHVFWDRGQFLEAAGLIAGDTNVRNCRAGRQFFRTAYRELLRDDLPESPPCTHATCTT